MNGTKKTTVQASHYMHVSKQKYKRPSMPQMKLPRIKSRSILPYEKDKG